MKLRKRKRKDGSWSYFADWNEGGKRRRHTFKGCHTEKLARLAFAEFELRHARGQLALPTQPNLTIADCLESNLEVKRANCVTRHIRNLEIWARQIVEFFGEPGVRSIIE